MSGEAWQESDQIRPATVHRAYGRGAAGYDAFVATLPGYRTHLRVSASRMGLGDGHGLRLLDVGCGTGVSTEALLTSVGVPRWSRSTRPRRCSPSPGGRTGRPG